MSISIKSLPVGARYILQKNPYYILGISNLASVEDANEAIQSMKQLESLGVASSYDAKTCFNIQGITGIERDEAHMQVALSEMTNEKRWLWFSSSKVECNGEIYDLQDNWKQITMNCLQPSDSYDAFLLYFLAMLIEDPLFQKSEKWEPIFTYVDNIVTNPSDSVAEIIRQGADINDFRKEVEIILKKALSEAGIENLCRLYPSMDYYCNFLSLEGETGIVYSLLNYILTYFIQWAETSVIKIKAIYDEIKQIYKKSNEINQKDAYRLVIEATNFISIYWDDFEYAIHFLEEQNSEKASDCRNRLIEITIKPLLYVMQEIRYASNRIYEVEAARIYSIIYKFAKDIFEQIGESWNFYKFDTDLLYFGLGKFSDDQLLAKGRYECFNGQIDNVKKVAKELAQRKTVQFHLLKFDAFMRAKQYDDAYAVFEDAFSMLGEKSNIEELEYILIYMYLMLDELYAPGKYDFDEYEYDFEIYDIDIYDYCTFDSSSDLIEKAMQYKQRTGKDDALKYWYLLMVAYKNGNLKACEPLARIYISEKLPGKDRMMADFFACEGKDVSAYCSYHYGIALYRGVGRNRDSEKGLAYIRSAADRGFPDAKVFMDKLPENQ